MILTCRRCQIAFQGSRRDEHALAFGWSVGGGRYLCARCSPAAGRKPDRAPGTFARAARSEPRSGDSVRA